MSSCLKPAAAGLKPAAAGGYPAFPWNFLGLPAELSAPERARAWILPVPYEGTTCWGAGTRDGPAAIIAASRYVEWFDHELGGEPVRDCGIHTLPPLASLRRSPEAMAERIAQAVAGILGGKPAPELLVVLGGEHTVSVGVARGLAAAGGAKNLVAVQLDAHADLRDEYEGSTYSHGCAARRILETCPLFQIGVRSLSAGEDEFRRQAKRLRTVFAGEAVAARAPWLKALARFVRGKRVHLTIDLDALDPGIMPAVGTPEPGGLDWARTIEIARVVCRAARTLAALDVVELAPLAGQRAPDFLAARLVYRIIALALARKKAR